jgi:hypothetical protein
MDTTTLISNFRADLARAAEVGGEDVRVAAQRLLVALDPALRLTLIEALSQAATEIGHALPGVTIDVRLKGREPEFVVEAMETGMPPPDAIGGVDDENVIRITLRLPEGLKAQAETIASRRGQSLNTWIVGAVRAAADAGTPGYEPRQNHKSRRHIKGWAR